MSVLDECERICAVLLRADKESASRIYFIEAVGANRIKIGRSNNVGKRIRSLQCASPFKLILLAEAPGSSFTETYFHNIFREHRVGGEWFSDCPEIRAHIGSLLTEYQNTGRNWS